MTEFAKSVNRLKGHNIDNAKIIGYMMTTFDAYMETGSTTYSATLKPYEDYYFPIERI